MLPLGNFSAADPEGLIAIAGLILGVVGVAVGVVYARRRAQLVFTQAGNVVVDATQPGADDIEIAWRGTKVPSVSRTRIAIWNDGALTLEGSAIVENYPLRLKFKGEVLSVSVLARSHKENGFDAWADPEAKDAVRIMLDYFDRHHGAVIEVVHGSNHWGGTPSGTIKGVPHSFIEREAWEEGDGVLGFVVIALSAVMVGSAISANSLVGKIATGLALALPGLLLLLLTMSKWRGRPPKALRISDKPDLSRWRRLLRRLP